GTEAAEAPEDQRRRADLDPVAVGQSGRARDALPADVGSVAALQILDRRVVPGDEDARVAARDAVQVDEDRRVGIASEDVLPPAERHLAIAPGDSAVEVGAGAGASRRPLLDRLARERVTESVNRSNVARPLRGVAERGAEHLHQPGETALGDERLRPQRV